MTSGSSTPRCRARCRTLIHPEAKQATGSAKRRAQRSANADGGPTTMVPAKSCLRPFLQGGRLQHAEVDPLPRVKIAQPLQRAMDVDRLLVTRLAQERDHPLRFAQRIGADQVGAVGKLPHGSEQLLDFGPVVGCRNTGSANVASVINTSQGTGSNARHVGSARRL
jgi:hypothetical protein